MISRHSVRHLVHAELAARLDAATDGDVTVQDGVTARDVTAETIAIGDSRAVSDDVPYMQAGRKQRRDIFEFDVEFQAALQSQTTPAEAKARAAAMFAWLEDILADDATLGALCHSIVISGYSGPDARPLSAGGFSALITATVRCDTQLN